MKKADLSIVIPTRNEERIVKENLMKLHTFVKSISNVQSYELVVSDFSTDNTPKIVDELQKKFGNIRLVQAKKRGIGEGIRQGIHAAKYPLVFFYPVDLTYNLESIPGIIRGVTDHDADIVLGSRRVKGGKEVRSKKRIYFSLLYSFFINLFFQLNIKDTQGTMLFKREKVMKFLSKITSNDGFFQTEMLIYGEKNGLLIREYPTVQVDRRDGESNVNPFKEGFSMFSQILKKMIEIKF